MKNPRINVFKEPSLYKILQIYYQASHISGFFYLFVGLKQKNNNNTEQN